MIYIVTPVFNRKLFTRNYLIALQRQTCKDFKVIIVDDDSSDGTSDMIREEFSNIILLKEKGDLWWAEATNIGVKYALNHGASYIMTLNDDTIPLQDYMEQMVAWSKKEPLALLGALAIDISTNKPIYGGEFLNWKTAKFENILTKIKTTEINGLKEVNNFPGRGLLIPKKVFEDIGFYDSKNFPQTVADLDFTCRAHKAGYKIYCNYDAKIKIYPEESGGVLLRKNKSWKNYYLHLFSMRGGGNLKWFTVFAFKNAPKRYRVQYWIQGMTRRIGGYMFEWLKESINGKK
jgi:GT2 family glycosyltransferase